jgi:hypothetical protein
MPTICDGCGEESYVIYITTSYERLCDKCYEKVRPKSKWEPDDIPYRKEL